jgi:hypothetical protein
MATLCVVRQQPRQVFAIFAAGGTKTAAFGRIQLTGD